MCHRIGLFPISTMGLGLTPLSSLILVPCPPAKITAFILLLSKNCLFTSSALVTPPFDFLSKEKIYPISINDYRHRISLTVITIVFGFGLPFELRTTLEKDGL